ncbi:hypothetical protein LZQ00_02995 [Sphingobacterium sp. SRCM116780]|uniref:hypothetical protein n=1 Tax=Sphingobacterium sp. SRCM116780 TaxID=2907623 RepID=UPI001F22958F|nr:hypothetical protein [Sphingobacterium sp. SRCM116780]UIR56791.1 hypothetical protein LZQ00_02995 [Sphingobacterium sp. SRCM116780]
MKPILLLLFLLLFDWAYGQSKPEIDHIVVNDYMSERNISVIGPIPAGYNKGIVDSLENSYVEYYEKGNLVKTNYYSTVGTLYYTRQSVYDKKNREIKELKIDEYKNDTCLVIYEYMDSLDILTSKQINNLCDSSRLDFYYQYNEKKQRVGLAMYENGKLYERSTISYPNVNEKVIKSHSNTDRPSTYNYRYNDKDDLVYEKIKKWESVRKDEYFEVEEENEYSYKYDQFGNWTERIKQNYCPLKPKSRMVKKRKSNGPPQVKTAERECFVEMKEKLIRRIYYKSLAP